MLKYLISLCVLIYTVSANGEFTVLHHPRSITFKGHDHLRESLLKYVFSASLGFTIEQDSNWQGMYLQDPFDLAEAVVTVAVDGVSDIGIAKGHNFPLRTDEDESTIYTYLDRKITERYPNGNGQSVRVDLSEGLEGVHGISIFSDIKHIKAKKTEHNHLKLNIDEDREYLQEIALLNAMIAKIESGVIHRDYIPDVFWFKVSALHALVDIHGENSTAVKEAKLLLNDAIVRLNNAFTKVYNGNVLVSTIASDFSHTRRTRSILEAKEENDQFSDLNLSKSYSADYPVIFNIILWFGVVMVFSLLAISLTIGNMDPGRDSIIYRMTSTRMKKDN